MSEYIFECCLSEESIKLNNYFYCYNTAIFFKFTINIVTL